LKGFKVGHLNIASLPKHIEELKIFLNEISFDILCINETRLINNSIENRLVEIPGYDIVRRDRNRYGGGVAIYIRNNLVYVYWNDLIPDILEAICIEVKKPRMKPLLVCSWYRAPDLNVEIFDHFETFLKKLNMKIRI
jgi:exonuclease III